MPETDPAESVRPDDGKNLKLAHLCRLRAGLGFPSRMRCAAWLRLRFAGGAVQADDLPFAVRPFEDARRDAGAFDRLAIREADRVVIGFGSDRDPAFAAHRALIILEGKGLASLQLQIGREK